MALLLSVIMEKPAQKETLTTNVSEDETEPTETTCWNQVILEKNPNLRTLTATEITKLFSMLYLVEDDYETGIETVAKSEEFKLLRYMIDCLMSDLKKIYRTAKLWLQYISYIQTFKNFVRAEKTGNWCLHLQSVHDMLNLFAATGHVHYAKSARLYYQQMMELKTSYPWVHHKFVVEGFHTVRRSSRF